MLTKLFLADLKADLAAGPLPIERLVDRWTSSRPSQRRIVRRRILDAEHRGHIAIDDGEVRWLRP